MITNKASKQYDLVHNKLIKSDDGLLRDEDGYIAVALGSHYGNIGDRFIIKFRNSKSVNVIKADEKDDKDTVKGCYHKSDGSIIEVIVDTKKINNFYPEARIMGDFNYSDLFNGEIKEVYKVIDEEKD